jgi:hypothetical protein
MKRGLAFFILIIISLQLVNAGEIFGVPGTDSPTYSIGPENIANWPEQVKLQCKQLQEKIIADCKNSGYQNWNVLRLVNGYSKRYQELLLGGSDYQTVRKKLSDPNFQPTEQDRENVFKQAAREPGSVVVSYDDNIENVLCKESIVKGVEHWTLSSGGTFTFMDSKYDFLETQNQVQYSNQYACNFICSAWNCEEDLIRTGDQPVVVDIFNEVLKDAPPVIAQAVLKEAVGMQVTQGDKSENYVIVIDRGKGEVKRMEKVQPTQKFSLMIHTTPEEIEKLIKSGNKKLAIAQAMQKSYVTVTGTGIIGKIAVEGMKYYLTPETMSQFETFLSPPTTFTFNYNNEASKITLRTQTGQPALVTLESQPKTPVVIGAQGNAIGYTTQTAQVMAERAALFAALYSDNAGIYSYGYTPKSSKKTNSNPLTYTQNIAIPSGNSKKNMQAGLAYGTGKALASTSTNTLGYFVG